MKVNLNPADRSLLGQEGETYHHCSFGPSEVVSQGNIVNSYHKFST